jgi:hypothetical protein
MHGLLLWLFLSLAQDSLCLTGPLFSLCLCPGLSLSMSLSSPSLGPCSVFEPHWPRRTTSLPSPPQCWSSRWWTRRPGLWKLSSW